MAGADEGRAEGLDAVGRHDDREAGTVVDPVKLGEQFHPTRWISPSQLDGKSKRVAPTA